MQGRSGADLYEYLSDEETVKYEPYRAMNMAETLEELEERISSEEMIAVELKAEKKLIGNVYLGKREFGLLKSAMCSTGAIGGRDMQRKAARQ